MNVKQLKEFLHNWPDNMQIVIPDVDHSYRKVHIRSYHLDLIDNVFYDKDDYGPSVDVLVIE